MRHPRYLIPLLLIALGWSAALALGSYVRFLPIVGAQGTPKTALIYACQCGAAIAWTMPDGRVLLTIQDHSRGGASIVGIDNGVTFTPLPDDTAAALAPQFQYPGEKQGVGSSVVAWGKIISYAPNRTVEGGSYDVWRKVSEIP